MSFLIASLVEAQVLFDPGVSQPVLSELCPAAECDASAGHLYRHHEHRQHYVQLLSLHVPGGQEERKHRNEEYTYPIYGEKDEVFRLSLSHEGSYKTLTLRVT